MGFFFVVVYFLSFSKGFLGVSDVKESTCNEGDPSLIPGFGRYPAGGHGNPLRYSCLDNSMDGGARWPTDHEVTRSRTRLSE